MNIANWYTLNSGRNPDTRRWDTDNFTYGGMIEGIVVFDSKEDPDNLYVLVEGSQFHPSPRMTEIRACGFSEKPIVDIS